jgi:hypothetical protein
VNQEKPRGLSRCAWCDKQVEPNEKCLVAYYHYLSLDEAIATPIEEYEAGRFCSWDCMLAAIRHREEAEWEKGNISYLQVLLEHPIPDIAFRYSEWFTLLKKALFKHRSQ